MTPSATPPCILLAGCIVLLAACGKGGDSSASLPATSTSATSDIPSLDSSSPPEPAADDSRAPSSSTPAPPVRAIASTGTATCALLEDGTVRCRDSHGVRDVAYGAVQVTVAAGTVCVLDRDGRVECGRLGWPMVLDPWNEVRVRRLVGTGCAITTDDKLVCRWNPRFPGVGRIRGPHDVVHAVVGGDRGCALDASHEVWCWSRGAYSWRASRVSAATGARQIALGADALYFVDESGAVQRLLAARRGWHGRARPVALPSAEGDEVVEIGAADAEAMCARFRSGALVCTGELALDADAASMVQGATALAVSTENACASVEGAVRCWGRNLGGSIAPAGNSRVPPAPTDFTGARVLAQLGWQVCASSDVESTCFGGMPGSGDPVRQPAPRDGLGRSRGSSQCVLSRGRVECLPDPLHLGADFRRLVRGLPEPMVELATIHEMGCALDGAGVVRCWAQHEARSYEDEEGGPFFVPAARVEPRVMPWNAVTSLASDSGTICALASDGAYCTSARDFEEGRPADHFPELAGARHLATSGWWLCGAMAGSVRCVKQLGGREVVEVSGLDAVQLQANDQRSAEVVCAVTTVGYVECFALGREVVGEPVRLPGLDEVEEIAMGADVDCARRRDGSVWCWGAGRSLGRVPQDATYRVTKPTDPFAPRG